MTAHRLLWTCVALLLALVGSSARADYFRPAYLQLTERAGGIYDVRWKAPAQGELAVMPIRPVFPAGARMARPLVSSYAAGAAVMTGQVRIPGGIEGKTIRFDGLADSGNQVLVRLIRRDGNEGLYKVSPTEPEVTIPRDQGAISVSARYTQLGIEHIWFGFDHLLFVAALFMLVVNLRTLFWTITSFTVAHSAALALVTLHVIRVPVPPVEAFIALSIVFVAVEVVRSWRGETTLASRKPWLVAFAFGLLHGMGFASALAQIGLPPNNVPLALLFFNIGVEIGQMLFVTGLLATSWAARHLASSSLRPRLRLASAYAIGGVASFWLLQRVASFGAL